MWEAETQGKTVSTDDAPCLLELWSNTKVKPKSECVLLTARGKLVPPGQVVSAGAKCQLSADLKSQLNAEVRCPS